MDFLIGHIILQYSSNYYAFGHRGHNTLQWQFLFWHGNRIISSQTRYKLVLFVHSCGRRHFKQSVSSLQRLPIFSSEITNKRASAIKEFDNLITFLNYVYDKTYMVFQCSDIRFIWECIQGKSRSNVVTVAKNSVKQATELYTKEYTKTYVPLSVDFVIKVLFRNHRCFSTSEHTNER